MPYDELLAQRVRRVLARTKSVEEKRMFGGLAFLLNGNLLVGVRQETLLVRLGEEQGEGALLEPHVVPFTIKGRGAMKGWVVIAATGVEDDEPLKAWIKKATKFVGSLAKK
jgi:TfoX/Sxy family transcriptional regulator of competence genes